MNVVGGKWEGQELNVEPEEGMEEEGDDERGREWSSLNVLLVRHQFEAFHSNQNKRSHFVAELDEHLNVDEGKWPKSEALIKSPLTVHREKCLPSPFIVGHRSDFVSTIQSEHRAG
jgi:hypothetical protein